MTGVLDRLLRNKTHSDAKSYFVGLERGRIWAEDCGDYFEIRQWSESDHRDFDDLTLPHDEAMHFRILSAESPLEWREYLRGWIEGVKEALERY